MRTSVCGNSTQRTPATLTAYELAALKRAVCEQAIYRAMRGEDEFVQDQDGIASVGNVTFSTQLPPRCSPASTR